jgi:biotin/methionine sulfoxide reductase
VHGREQIRIHPEDAGQRGIGHGDVVRVFNDRGACLAAAHVDGAMAPHVVIMATGAWFDPSDAGGELERHGNPNVLTSDVGTSRLTQGPSALSALVDIELWRDPLPPIQAWNPPAMAFGGSTAPRKLLE